MGIFALRSCRFVRGWRLESAGVLSVWGGFAFATCALLCGAVTLAAADEGDATPQVKPEITAFAERVFTITDIILDHHIDPPTRQPMLLAGIKAMPGVHGGRAELARRVSDVRDARDLAQVLSEIWAEWDRAKEKPQDVEAAFIRGMLDSVPGGTQLSTADEVRVAGQLAGNRYVGVGIAIGIDKENQLPFINSVVPGGPAEKAGIKEKDLIEQVDDTPFRKGESIQEYISITRGAEGSRVTFHVRQPDSQEKRIVEMIRSPINLGPTLAIGETPEEVRLPIGYVRITQIGGSTVHELRLCEAELRKKGAQALILDLRGRNGRGGHAHAAMMLADSLIAGKPLARLRTRSGTRVFTADHDCLFRDWPIAVLIDAETSGAAEWIAGALLDAREPGPNSGILLIGLGTAGQRWVSEPVFLPGGDEAIVMATGVMERVHGNNPSHAAVTSRPARRSAGSEEPPAAPVMPDVPVAQNDPVTPNDPRRASARPGAQILRAPTTLVAPSTAAKQPNGAPAEPATGLELDALANIESSATDVEKSPNRRQPRVGNPVKIAVDLLTMKLQKRDQASKE